MKEHKDEELIERFKQGDEYAFELLYQKHAQYLYYIALKLTHNQEDAKDAVQLAFLQMYQSIESLQNPKYFRLWMNKIIHGKCYNLFQRNRDVIVDTDTAEWTNRYQETNPAYLPEEQIKFTSDQDILHALIAKLPYSSQEILELHYFSQFKGTEIAQILDIPIGTVKSRIYAAKKALRKEIKEYEELHHHKLTFHFPGALSLLLWLDYHKGFYTSIGKKAMLSSISSNAVIFTAAAAVLAPVALGAGWQIMQAQTEQGLQYHQSRINEPNKEYSAQHAYFRLKQLAFDESQMVNREVEVMQEATQLYEALEDVKGSYWELLKKENWTLDFKHIKK